MAQRGWGKGFGNTLKATSLTGQAGVLGAGAYGGKKLYDKVTDGPQAPAPASTPNATPPAAPPATGPATKPSTTQPATNPEGKTDPTRGPADGLQEMWEKYKNNLASGDKLTVGLTAGIPLAALGAYALTKRKKNKEQPVYKYSNDQLVKAASTATRIRAMVKLAQTKQAQFEQKTARDLAAAAADVLGQHTPAFHKAAGELRAGSNLMQAVRVAFPRAQHTKVAQLLLKAAHTYATKIAGGMAMAPGSDGTTQPDASGAGMPVQTLQSFSGSPAQGMSMMQGMC
jgi:hypothetical protein